jgi:hypothetical protein
VKREADVDWGRETLAMTNLLLQRVTEPRAGAEGQEDYDVIGDVSGGYGLVIGRIFRASTAPAATPWMWMLSYEERKDNGLEPTREAAMQAFARNWERERGS